MAENPLINFESSLVRDRERQLKREARQQILAQAADQDERRKRRASAAVARGETTWMLPAVEAALRAQPGAEPASKVKKKKKKKRKQTSDSSDSEQEWVEKPAPAVTAKTTATAGLPQTKSTTYTAAAAKVATGTIPTVAAVRDDWLEVGALVGGTFTRDQLRRREGGSRVLAKQEQCKKQPDKIGSHARELNPYFKDGGAGLPHQQPPQEQQAQQRQMPAAAAATPSFGNSAEWLRKALRRAREQAAEEGILLEEIAASRWGSLEKFEQMLREAEQRDHEYAESQRIMRRPGDFDREQRRRDYVGRVGRQQERREDYRNREPNKKESRDSHTNCGTQDNKTNLRESKRQGEKEVCKDRGKRKKPRKSSSSSSNRDSSQSRSRHKKRNRKRYSSSSNRSRSSSRSSSSSSSRSSRSSSSSCFSSGNKKKESSEQLKSKAKGRRDGRSKSRSRRSRSRDERSKSRDRKSSKDRKSRSRDRKSRSRDRRSKSRDGRSRSRDGRSRSRDGRSRRRDGRSRSRDGRSRSRDGRSRSRDGRSRSRDGRSRSRDGRSRSRDGRSRSRDGRSKSKNKGWRKGVESALPRHASQRSNEQSPTRPKRVMLRPPTDDEAHQKQRSDDDRNSRSRNVAVWDADHSRISRVGCESIGGGGGGGGWRKKAAGSTERPATSTVLKSPSSSDGDVAAADPQVGTEAGWVNDSNKVKPNRGNDEAAAVAAEVPSQDVPPPLNDHELNKLGARLVKAELLGNMSLAKKLKKKLDDARQRSVTAATTASAGGVSGEVTADARPREEVVILTTTSARGLVRPTAPVDEDEAHGRAGRAAKKKKAASVTGGAAGERRGYFPDDDKWSLKQMFEQEKTAPAGDADAVLMRAAARAGRAALDDDYDLDDVFVDKSAPREQPSVGGSADRLKAIMEHQRREKATARCGQCLDGAGQKKHLIVSLGTTCYLALPAHQSLVDGHCLIVPREHVSASTELDENVWEEMMVYRKSLVRFYASRDEDVVFSECCMRLQAHPHTVLHCLPLPRDMGDLAPVYFKKAVQESEGEWSQQNRSVVPLGCGGVRRAVPRGFPYFAVDFGNTPGYAHVIEDEATFPIHFGQSVVGGMTDAETGLWRKPRIEKFDEQRRKVLAFARHYEPYDPATPQQ